LACCLFFMKFSLKIIISYNMMLDDNGFQYIYKIIKSMIHSGGKK